MANCTAGRVVDRAKKEIALTPRSNTASDPKQAMGGIRTGALLEKGNREAEDEQKIPKAVLSTICRLRNK
jgi:hypothetical protein